MPMHREGIVIRSVFLLRSYEFGVVFSAWEACNSNEEVARIVHRFLALHVLHRYAIVAFSGLHIQAKARWSTALVSGEVEAALRVDRDETGSIWTHLVLAAWFLLVAAQFGLGIISKPEWPHWQECSLVIGLIGATDDMLFVSVNYYACRSGDEQMNKCMLAIDESGIAVLVA